MQDSPFAPPQIIRYIPTANGVLSKGAPRQSGKDPEDLSQKKEVQNAPGTEREGRQVVFFQLSKVRDSPQEFEEP